MRKVGRMKGMPTKLSAVGILVGTLIAIGFFPLLIFTHLTLGRKKDLDQPADSVILKAAVCTVQVASVGRLASGSSCIHWERDPNSRSTRARRGWKLLHLPQGGGMSAEPAH